MEHWSREAIFYHIYPLGLCGAPPRNDFTHPPVPRLAGCTPGWTTSRAWGANALYLGPLFESSPHGYDTADYYQVDRRLGDNETLRDSERRPARARHAPGAGRRLQPRRARFLGFPRRAGARRRLRLPRLVSAACASTGAARTTIPSPTRAGTGTASLVKLNLSNPAVREHLFQAVRKLDARLRDRRAAPGRRRLPGS